METQVVLDSGGMGLWSSGGASSGYLLADFLNKDILIGLAIVNPVYFFCMMIGAMNTLRIIISVIGGTLLGPIFYLFSTEWAILFGGLTAGRIAF